MTAVVTAVYDDAVGDILDFDEDCVVVVVVVYFWKCFLIAAIDFRWICFENRRHQIMNRPSKPRGS